MGCNAEELLRLIEWITLCLVILMFFAAACWRWATGKGETNE